MEELIDFFIDVGKLKRKKRKGWTVLHRIENSESIASHIFRVAILTWILGGKKDLDLEKGIKMALAHDIIEVYAEDETPYDRLLSEDTSREEIKEMRKHRSRTLYSPEERKERVEDKFKQESRGLEKLILKLPSDLKSELRNLWLDYEKRMSKEGEFVKQIDKLENLLQALQYWEEQGQIERELWIIAAREKITDPLLIKFLKAIDERFALEDREQERGDKMGKLVDFFINVGKLKRIPRRGLLLVGKKNPGVVADHIFRLALMAWFLGKKKGADFDAGKILKTALINDLCNVFTSDKTPYDYDEILPEDKEEWPELFDKWPRLSAYERMEKAVKKNKREFTSLKKLVSALSSGRRREILNLWFDYQQGLSKEARFVKQVNRLETLLQVLEYAEQDQVRPFKSWWIGSNELIDDPLLIEFMDGLDQKFHHLKSYPRRTITEKK